MATTQGMLKRAVIGLVLLAAPVGSALAAGSALFEQMKAQFAKDFGVELVADDETYPVAESGGAISARNAGARNCDMMLYFLRKEFGKYPPELVKLSGLRRIVFCRDLKAGPNRIAGVALQANGTFYVDSSTEIGDEAHRRRTLHHEFFHCIDYRIHEGRDINDSAEWTQANSPGTTYGGTDSGAPVANWASHPAPGFVSNYSRKAVPEDRAELFAGIMTNNLTVRLLLQKDSFLTAKLAVMKAELQAFCPAIDEAFWTKTAKNF